MALTLHYHPLSSSCWKVLIALYECDIAFEPQMVNLGDPEARAAFVDLWPTGKIPLLADGGQAVPETTVAIEYLAQHHAADPTALMPAEPRERLEARLMERLLDLYVMVPMQAIVADRLRAPADRNALNVTQARATLAMAYGMLETRLGQRAWMAGDHWSLADCAAAPALFYATTLVPLGPEHGRLARYFERVVQRPSVTRVLQEAQPYFAFYPYHDALPARFLAPAR